MSIAQIVEIIKSIATKEKYLTSSRNKKGAMGM